MSSTPHHVREAYDQWAANYDSAPNPTRDLSISVLRNYEADLTGARVLEIGCGTGLNTVWISGLARKVTACDHSEQMLALARKRAEADHVDFHPIDLTRHWPFDAVYDVIVDQLVLEHIDDLGHIYDEAKRLLVPGGKFIITELHPYKQLNGSQARFVKQGENEETHVPAFTHMVSEYIDAGLDRDFQLLQLREWSDPGAEEALPRLLTLVFERE